MKSNGERRDTPGRSETGRRPEALTEKIKEGQKADVMLLPAELDGADMPPVREFLIEQQRDGTELCAKEVYEETYGWLKERKSAFP